MMLTLRPLVHYADFRGRSKRSEFWLFYLFMFAVTFICVATGVIIERTTTLPGSQIGFQLLNGIYLATAIPWAALTVRRLHDIGKSGWWAIAVFIPFGIVLLFFFLIREGDTGDNQFGKVENRDS